MRLEFVPQLMHLMIEYILNLILCYETLTFSTNKYLYVQLILTLQFFCGGKLQPGGSAGAAAGL